jgi:hypothetical protein
MCLNGFCLTRTVNGTLFRIIPPSEMTMTVSPGLHPIVEEELLAVTCPRFSTWL